MEIAVARCLFLNLKVIFLTEEKPVEKVVGGPTAARGLWNWSYKTCTGACGRNMDRGGGGK